MNTPYGDYIRRRNNMRKFFDREYPVKPAVPVPKEAPWEYLPWVILIGSMLAMGVIYAASQLP